MKRPYTSPLLAIQSFSFEDICGTSGLGPGDGLTDNIDGNGEDDLFTPEP